MNESLHRPMIPQNSLIRLGESLAAAWTELDEAEQSGKQRRADAAARTIARIEQAIARGQPRNLEEVLLLCRLALSRLADEDGVVLCEAMLIRINLALEGLLGIERGRFAGDRYVPRA